MKVRIHWRSGEHYDSMVIEADTLKQLMQRAIVEVDARGADDYWSDPIEGAPSECSECGALELAKCVCSLAPARTRLITEADVEREFDSLGADEGVAQCPTCEGDGCGGTFYLDGSPQPCPTCSGGGIVRASSESTPLER